MEKIFSQLLLSNQQIEQKLNSLESEQEKENFPNQPVANPRGTTQDKVFAVESTSTGSLKAIISLHSGRQPSHGVQYPSDSKHSAKFIPPSSLPPVPHVQPNSVIHLIQIKHLLLILLGFLTLTNLSRLANLSCLKILGRS